MLKIKRAYETPSKDDGVRVLIDRLWPRGVSKQKAKIDLWLKDIAPSDNLRKWFGHKPGRWEGFRERYLNELKDKPAAVGELEKISHQKPTTLVYAAKDKEHNNAVVIKDLVGEG